jgi:hypothetical protein
VVGSQPGPFGCDSSTLSKTTGPWSFTTTRTSTVSGSVKAAWLTRKVAYRFDDPTSDALLLYAGPYPHIARNGGQHLRQVEPDRCTASGWKTDLVAAPRVIAE